MIYWGNLSQIWLFLPIVLIVYLLIICAAKFKFELVKLLAKHDVVTFARYNLNLKIKLILWATILICLLVAVLAPQWGEHEQLVPQVGRNVVIALDISKSMLAEDFKPNRLDFAKNKIKKLISSLAGDRIGLVLFAGDAIVMCPLTRDREVLLAFLDDASVQTISNGMTNLTSAITLATSMVQQANDGATNLLTIFTDGEDFSSGWQEAANLAKQVGIHIFTIGVASVNGAPVPDIDLATGAQLGFIKDQKGQVVISKLNQDLLQIIAQQCGGDSIIAQVDQDHDLKEIKDWISNFERHRLSDQKMVIKAEKYYYFGALAFILLLIEWLL